MTGPNSMTDEAVRAGEIFKSIPDYEDLYEISNCGRIKSLGNGDSNLHRSRIFILKPYRERWGYLHIRLYKHGIGKYYKLHRLVGFVFIPNPDKLPEINHKNGKRDDNRVENLEWCDRRHNASHIQRKTSSRYTGVSWDKRKNKWAANITTNKKKKWLGYFMDEKKAAETYQNELKKSLAST